jgi:hypothetical protein
MPPPEVPLPPKLLPISSVAAISWQGSVGATAYDVERAEQPKGPWTIVGKDVDDTWVRYRPLYSDGQAKPGMSYCYRVRAKNATGVSAPSNLVGPVEAMDQFLVDELIDFSQMAAHEGTLTLETANARPYREDPHRVKGSAGASILYRVADEIRSATVLTLMEGAEKELEFYLSNDGKSFNRITPKVTRFASEGNLYGYKLPIKYELEDLRATSTHLRISFTGEAQISRVELRYGR